MVLSLETGTKAQAAAHVSLCASNHRQLILGLHSWGADNDGKLPPGSGYSHVSTVPNRGQRGSGDFWDELYPALVPDRDVWYCPAGPYFADMDTATYPAIGFRGTFWDFDDTITTGNAYFSIAVLCNAYKVPQHYQDIPQRLDEPGQWVLTNDYIIFDDFSDVYGLTNHPGTTPGWDNTLPIAPDGTNVGRLDGSVHWVPETASKPGYPGGGGPVGYLRWRMIE